MKKMNMHWIFRIILAIALIAVVLSMIPKSSDLSGKECKIDADCVKASCCHPTSCVAKESAPNCDNNLCSQECVPNTLDCGQGSCVCNQGTCGVSFK
ncbi:MAG: preprotein translocase subunit SecG [Nanoarchaeota archaeon]|nr:preprotein translocase subunit SecG [Nanoarchaeota archaeon]